MLGHLSTSHWAVADAYLHDLTSPVSVNGSKLERCFKISFPLFDYIL